MVYYFNMIDSGQTSEQLPHSMSVGIALASRDVAKKSPNFSELMDATIIGKPRGVIALVKNLRSSFLLKKNATTGLSQRELSELEKIQKEDARFNKELEIYNQAKRQGEFERKNSETKDKKMNDAKYEAEMSENQKNYTDLGASSVVQEIAFFENDVYDQTRKQVVNERDKLGLKDEQVINAETIRRMEEIINQLSLNFIKGRIEIPFLNRIFFKKALRQIEAFKQD